MKRSPLSLSILALTALLGAGALAAAPDALASARKAGVLRIGQEGTYPPFTYKNEQGELVGFDVDVAKAVAGRLGLKARFTLTEWSGIIAGLQANKYDLIVNEVAVTPERKRSLDFSAPYAESSAALILPRGSSVKSLKNLVGKKVGVGLGSNYETIARSVQGVKVVTYPGSSEYLADLAAGRLDAALNDRLMVAYLVKTSQLPVQAGPVVGEAQPIAIAMRKGNPQLKAAVDKAIGGIKADGTYATISKRWFGVDISKPTR